LAKPGKRDGTGSSIAETHVHHIYAEPTDSSVSESISDTPGELAKASSPPKSLSDTLVSNEFTNLDELLSDSQQDNIATTDFSIEENLEPIQDEYNGLEWNNSGLADSDSIPFQDPDLEMAAALNFNSNNNNNYLEAEDDYNYGGLPPPPEIPPPFSARSGEDSDEWERDSNRTGELNFDSDSSTSKHSIEDGIVALDEEAGPGGVVLLNVKRTDDDSPAELEQIDETLENAHLIPPPAASIPRDPSIGTQLDELDDVVSSLAELAAEVPFVPPPPPIPRPAPSLLTASQPHPITSSTPTQGEEHRSSSPEPPPIPLTLPPSLSDNEEFDDDNDFPLGPPPPLVTSEPPSLTPSPPSSPTLTDSRASEKEQQQQQDEEDRDFELLNKLKQRQVKGLSSRRRRRGSRDQEAVDDGESELLEKLKQRQTLYKQKAKARREEVENEPSSTTEHASAPHSIPSQPPGMGTGTGGETVQLQLQFLQQQVLQQQMMQLQQQFQHLHSYALQQGVSMPTNMMQVPGVGGAMLNQQAAFMATPMAPPTGVAPQPQQQQLVMQTSAGPVLVPAAQMMPGQGIMPNPQAPMQPQQMGQLPGQGFAPNAATLPVPGQQQAVYGQGIVQPQTQPPLMSTSVATSQPVMYGQGISQDPPPPPLPQSQPPITATTSIASNEPMTYGQGVSQDQAPPPLPQTAPPPAILSSLNETASNPSQESTTGTGTKVTPARILSQQKKRSEDVRALVLGPLEDQFDSLMDQVRDADPTAVLKKVGFAWRENLVINYKQLQGGMCKITVIA
jgi:hypothetical protein